MAKVSNYYASRLRIYSRIPKAVLAAIAISALTAGGDHLSEADTRLLKEWWILYQNGIVAQRPPREI